MNQAIALRSICAMHLSETTIPKFTIDRPDENFAVDQQVGAYLHRVARLCLLAPGPDQTGLAVDRSRGNDHRGSARKSGGMAAGRNKPVPKETSARQRRHRNHQT